MMKVALWLRIVLVGGGHAHLKCLARIKIENASLNHSVILISPDRYQYYSGMFSGFTEGIYSLDDIRIDLKNLAERAGITFIEEKVVNVSVYDKTLTTEDGAIVPFDVVSFDIGSNMEIPPSFAEWLVPIKPNYLFAEKIISYRKKEYPVVVGGGASGVELALAMTAWRNTNGYPQNVTLITSSTPLPSSSRKATTIIRNVAASKGLRIIEGDTVKEMHGTHITTKNQVNLPHSHVLWVTGPRASGIFHDSHLPCDENGFLLVKNTLQAKGMPYIFGAGDCITMEKHPQLPKNGVYAVRQGELLWENITRYLKKETCRTFNPQRHFLSLISTGNQEALFQYANFTFHHKIAWKLKHKIDVAFMRKHQ